MSSYHRAAKWLGTKRLGATLGRRVFTPIDKRMAGHSVLLSTLVTGLPVGHLTAVGRRSGLPRTVPLVYVVPEGAVAAVVGTNFGGPDHPQWVANLQAEPRATWRVDEDIAVVARLVSPGEHRDQWARFVEIWPGYEGYRERSRREPRMFILEDR